MFASGVRYHADAFIPRKIDFFFSAQQNVEPFHYMHTYLSFNMQAMLYCIVQMTEFSGRHPPPYQFFSFIPPCSPPVER